jgi:hypothetical protein
MTGKMRWIVLAVLVVVGFCGSYLVSGWLGGGGKLPDKVAPAAPQQTEDMFAETPQPTSAPAQQPSVVMKEKELNALIKELRLKMEACSSKEGELDKREKRIEMAGELLKKQAKEVEALQMQLNAPLMRLQQAKAELESGRVRIQQTEKANLKQTASIYEKMDSSSCGAIVVGMCKNSQEDDAAKILFYMSPRAAAKLLAAVPDKDLVAKLCQKLKKIQEEG